MVTVVRIIPTLSCALIALLFWLPCSGQSPIAQECSTPGATIDSAHTTVIDTLDITSAHTIAAVHVAIHLSHAAIDELTLTLSHGGTTVELHTNAAGVYPGIDLVFDDAGGNAVTEGFDCDCHVRPTGNLSDFVGSTSQGTWTLTIVDNNGAAHDGLLERWCVRVFDVTPTPPPPPVTSLFCSSLPGTGLVQLAWTNPVTFDSIEVRIDGAVAALLPGTAFTYLTTPLPVPSIAEIEVVGHLNATPAPGRSCLVGVQPQVDVEGCRNPATPISEILPEIDFLTIVPSIVIGDLQVSLDVTHSAVSDLVIDITSPLGTAVRLHNGGGNDQRDFDLTYWDYGLVNGSVPYSCDCLQQVSGPGSLADFIGQTTNGLWRVTVQDLHVGASGVLNNWCVQAYTDPPQLPMSDLACTPAAILGSVDVSWIYPADQDSVEVFVNGTLEATLFGPFTAGNTGNYTTLPVPSAGPVEVCVRGVVGGAAGPQRCSTVEVALPAVDSLGWSLQSSTGAIGLSWANAASYDSVQVTINGGAPIALPGTATSYVTAPLPTLSTQEICVTATSPFGTSASSCVHALVTPPVNIESCASPQEPIDHTALTTSTITLLSNEAIQDVEIAVSLSHAFVGDLTVAVTSPSGTQIRLHDQGGVDGENLVVLYTDSGIPNAAPYDCGCPMQPSGVAGAGSLQDLLLEPSAGDWVLSILDSFDEVNGTLEHWCVRIPQSCGVLPPNGLSCVVSEPNVQLSWLNGSVYDMIEVLRDGFPLAALSGTANSFVDTPPPGRHQYQLVGTNAAQGCSTPSGVCSAVFGVTDLIFRGEGNGLVDSAGALRDALVADGRVPLIVDELTPTSTAVPNSTLEVLWLTLGTFPANHPLTSAEGLLLAELHTGDVGLNGTIDNVPLPVYIEGADTWGFDAPTAFSSYDGVISAQDGDNTLSAIVGAPPALGFDFLPLGAPYTQDQISTDATDRLIPTSAAAPELGGAVAAVTWKAPLIVGAYNIAVYYASTIAPVWCQSFEFGGYGGDRNQLVAIYRDALLSSFTPTPTGDLFRRGDFDASGGVLINDPVSMLVYLFSGGAAATCADAADANDDGTLGIADAVAGLSYLFGNAPPLPTPGPTTCGTDQTQDGLPDCVYNACP